FWIWRSGHRLCFGFRTSVFAFVSDFGFWILDLLVAQLITLHGQRAIAFVAMLDDDPVWQRPAIHLLVIREVQLARIPVLVDGDFSAEELLVLEREVPLGTVGPVLGVQHLGVHAQVLQALWLGIVGGGRIERLVSAVGEFPLEALLAQQQQA